VVSYSWRAAITITAIAAAAAAAAITVNRQEVINVHGRLMFR